MEDKMDEGAVIVEGDSCIGRGMVAYRDVKVFDSILEQFIDEAWNDLVHDPQKLLAEGEGEYFTDTDESTKRLMLDNMGGSGYGWKKEEVRKLFVREASPISELKEGELAYNFVKNGWFSYAMSGQEFLSFPSTGHFSIIYQGQRVNLRLSGEEADTFRVEDVSFISGREGELQRLLTKKFVNIIKQPSNFDDPAQLQRYKAYLEKYFHEDKK